MSLVLAACDFGGEKSVKQWKKVPVNSKLSETRTAGENYKWVLMSMAETKDMELKPLSNETPTELLDAENIEPVNAVPPQGAKGQSMMGIRISKKIEVPYGPLNFYGTRPREREDKHILDERPEIKIEKQYEQQEFDESTIEELVEELKQSEIEQEIKQEVSAAETKPKPEIKRADKIFEKFALGNKKYKK